jgi:hypothetical protein
MFAEIDRQVRSWKLTDEQQQALERSKDALPHLAPETVLAVMSETPDGALDAPGVFDVAYGATDRGVSALSFDEAQELRELQRALLGTLRPSERERMREYDRARARGVVFDFEHRVALVLYARGARALPPSRRERLRVLSGKAVAAGLGHGDPDES